MKNYNQEYWAKRVVKYNNTRWVQDRNFIETFLELLPQQTFNSILEIIDILKNHCNVVNLRRLDETSESLEASFMIETEDFVQLNIAKKELQKINHEVKITLLDNRGLL